MAKLDANGRPIYETAEEYNKAHGTGTSRRTYDSPEGDNYKHNSYKQTQSYQKAVERQKSPASKTKKLLLILVVVIIVTQILAIFTILRATTGVFDSYEENWYEDDWGDFEDGEDNGYGEYVGDDSTPLVEGFQTFSYNGETYTLPTTFQEITKMGFTLEEEYDDNYELRAGYEELLILNGADGYMDAMIRVNNKTDEDILLEECIVDYFYIENEAAYYNEEPIPDFVFGNGLTFESSYEDVEAYFGTPYYHYSDHDGDDSYYDSYEWAYYGTDEVQYVNITFWNGVITDVGIEKREYEEK